MRETSILFFIRMADAAKLWPWVIREDDLLGLKIDADSQSVPVMLPSSEQITQREPQVDRFEPAPKVAPRRKTGCYAKPKEEFQTT
jgi:hypothetical protein